MASDTASASVLRTKLNRPRLPSDVVARPALLDRLNQNRSRLFTLVSAPAGYGKSTLVSNWLEDTQESAAWLSLDARDNEFSIFLAHFIAALQTLFPSIGQKIVPFLEAADLPPAPYLAKMLLNELQAQGRAFVLVLDDYHFIHQESVHELLSEFLRYPPRSMHLVVITRRDPPLPVASLRAQGKITEIRTHDLRFSHQEAMTFLKQAIPLLVNDQVVRSLEAKTEGWVAGLRLLALSLQRRPEQDDMFADLQGESHYVADYLLTEVLTRQPPDIQTYLLRTAILDRFCAPLCEYVVRAGSQTATPVRDGQAFIQWLQETNLFCIALDDQRRWFRYHHLFQNLLQRESESQIGRSEIAHLHARASAWLGQHDCIDEALDHALAADDVTAAVRLFIQHRRAFMNAEQWGRLERWLGVFPRPIVEAEPELLMQEAWRSQRQNQVPEMVATLDRIESLLSSTPRQTNEDGRLRGEIDTLRGFQYYHAADGERAIRYEQQALQGLSYQQFSEQGWAVIILAAAYQMRGQLKRAHRAVSEALHKHQDPSKTYDTRLIVSLCFIEWLEANLPTLKQTAAQLLQLATRHNLPESTVHGRYFMGIAHYHHNELADAEKIVAPVVQDPYNPHLENFVHATFCLALSYWGQGRADDAFGLVESVTAHVLERRNASLLSLFQAFQVELTLRQGRLDGAARWADQYKPEPFRSMYRFYVPELTLAKVYIAQGTHHSYRHADTLLSRLSDFVARTHNTSVRIKVLALQALLLDARGDQTTALSVLSEAVGFAQPGGGIRCFVDLGPKLAALLERLTLGENTASYVGHILAAFRDDGSTGLVAKPPDVAPRLETAQRLADPLTNREIDTLVLLAQRLSNKEIAAQLFIAPGTVKRHTLSIYQKLSVHNRRQAVAEAARLGLLPH